MTNLTIKLNFFIICLTLLSQSVNGQVVENNQVFRDDVIPKIEIIIPEDFLDLILDNNNLESNYHFHVTFIFDDGNIFEYP